jgi:long-chain acyl-CoA synthetase
MARQNSSDVAIMFHTSGTTGDPKLVMLTHINLITNAQSHNRVVELGATDNSLIVLPMFFSYCNTAQLLAHTMLGSSIVIYDQSVFLPKRFCDLVQQHRIQTTVMVSTMLAALADYRYLAHHNMSSIRYIFFGAGPTPTTLLARLYRMLPSAGFVQTYGQSECSPRVTALRPEWSEAKVGSVGTAIPGVEVEIVDDGDRQLPVGQIGEIRVRGPNVMAGYYKQTTETQRVIRCQWLYTGDLAYRDKDGCIYITGRRKNMIVSGGINIYPEELETAILAHSKVKDVRVRGEQDHILGERVVAEIVPRNGVTVTLSEINQFLEGKIARYKWPKEINLKKILCKTATGKTRRVQSRSTT